MECFCKPVRWKGRPAYLLSNDTLGCVLLQGGGHIAELRHSQSRVNVLWEAPWQTIDPQSFSYEQHAQAYGHAPAGKFLCGFTGHALALPFFGMPSESEAAQGLPLHGEASSREWEIADCVASRDFAELEARVHLPAYGLTFRRTLHVNAGSEAVRVEETVRNLRGVDAQVQWVEHVTFGEPFFRTGDATLSVPVQRAITWPRGYEERAALLDNAEFQWPHAPAADGGTVDLSAGFVQTNKGFVGALQLDESREHAFIAIHNRTENLVAGYVFDRRLFPWVALWEENLARDYAPWNGRTRARGVEFGTSPMPLGLRQALDSGPLFGTPVLTRIPAEREVSTTYYMFVAPVPATWDGVRDVQLESGQIVVRSSTHQDVRIRI